MLIVKPKGRGNWRSVVIAIEQSKRVPPLLIRAGQLLPLGGVVFRIAKVLP